MPFVSDFCRPDRRDLPVLAEERRTRLLELVRTRGFAALPDLADALAVSESTVPATSIFWKSGHGQANAWRRVLYRLVPQTSPF